MKYKRLQMAKPIAVKLDLPLLQRIDALSTRLGEAKSTIMRMAMRIGLESLEKATEPARAAKLTSLSRYPAHTPEHAIVEEPKLPASSQKANEARMLEILKSPVAGKKTPPPK